MNRYIAKIAIAGEGGTGKTTLLHRWVDGIFIPDTKMTIGSSFMVKTLSFGDKSLLLQIWDLGGEKQFRNILKGFVQGAVVTLYTFSLNNYYSFYNAEEWITLIREGGCGNIVAVGTKADLPILVPDEEIKKLVEKNRLLGYFKVSSKTGENVEELFNFVAKTVAERIFII
ncbi:MAG: Rab family GTPase [Candidatus Korarchaeota archaeon]